MSPAEWHTRALEGLPVQGLDNRQNTVRGRLRGARRGLAAIQDARGVLRLVHPRYVYRDWCLCAVCIFGGACVGI